MAAVPKHVIFDLGNVLVDIHPRRTITELARLCDRTEGELDDFFLSPTHLDFMAGASTPVSFYEAFTSRYDTSLGYREFIDVWKELIGDGRPGMADCVARLRGRCVLSVCSNTDAIHWRMAKDHCPFLGDFDHHFLSYRLRQLKPGADIFLHMLDRLQVMAPECLFIDDTLENTQTAAALGFQTLHAGNEIDVRRKIEAAFS